MTVEPMDKAMTMGERIMLARRRTGLEQTDVAVALDVSRALVSLWERDKSIPRADKLQAFAELTGWPVMYFYGDDTALGGLIETPRIPVGSDGDSPATLGVVGQQSFTFAPLSPLRRTLDWQRRTHVAHANGQQRAS